MTPGTQSYISMSFELCHGSLLATGEDFYSTGLTLNGTAGIDIDFAFDTKRVARITEYVSQPQDFKILPRYLFSLRWGIFELVYDMKRYLFPQRRVGRLK